LIKYKDEEMAGTFFTIDTWEFIKGIWDYAIKPLWWVWLLALAIGLLPTAIDFLFRKLKKKLKNKK